MHVVVSKRDERGYQKQFESVLRQVRQLFLWRDGQVVEARGRFGVPVNKMVTPEDVELLREVYRRLPPPSYQRPTSLDPEGLAGAQGVTIDDALCSRATSRASSAVNVPWSPMVMRIAGVVGVRRFWTMKVILSAGLTFTPNPLSWLSQTNWSFGPGLRRAMRPLVSLVVGMVDSP